MARRYYHPGAEALGTRKVPAPGLLHHTPVRTRTSARQHTCRARGRHASSGVAFGPERRVQLYVWPRAVACSLALDRVHFVDTDRTC